MRQEHRRELACREEVADHHYARANLNSGYALTSHSEIPRVEPDALGGASRKSLFPQTRGKNPR